MRDYLEELVELVQVEEEEWVLSQLDEWNQLSGRTGIGRGKIRREESDVLQAEPRITESEADRTTVRPNGETELFTRLHQVRTLPVQRGEAQKARTKTQETLGNTQMVGTDGLQPTGEAGGQAEETARLLRRSLVRAEQAAGYRVTRSQEERTALSREPVLQKDGVASSAQIEARQVDRVFERDARRYDNRFTLF